MINNINNNINEKDKLNSSPISSEILSSQKPSIKLPDKSDNVEMSIEMQDLSSKKMNNSSSGSDLIDSTIKNTSIDKEEEASIFLYIILYR